MIDIFDTASSHPVNSPEDPDMIKWFKQPVQYQGLVVTRTTAQLLCAEECLGWTMMEEINHLPTGDTADVIDTATAYGVIASRQKNYGFSHSLQNASRDV